MSKEIQEADVTAQVKPALLFNFNGYAKKAAVTACVSMILLQPFAAHAKKIKDIPGQIQLTAVSAFNAVSHYPAVFETTEKRSTKLKAFTKWTDMFKRFERELKSSEGSAYIETLSDDLSDLRGLSIEQSAKKVNTLMNQKRYITDNRNWGKSDYWATPVEFMRRGGDCEDFAIAKYTALRMLGVPEERLRIAIVHDKVKNIPHAVLVVYAENGPLVLDNQIKSVIDASEQGRYRPIFTINRLAWWLHSEKVNTRLASLK